MLSHHACLSLHVNLKLITKIVLTFNFTGHKGVPVSVLIHLQKSFSSLLFTFENTHKPEKQEKHTHR